MDSQRNPNSGRLDASKLRAAAILLTLAILSPGFVFIGWQSVINAQTNVLNWADDSLDSAKNFGEFRDRFGSQESVIVSWSSCQIGDSQADLMAERLRNSTGADYFRSVTTTAEMIERLQEDDLAIPASTISDRLRGVYLGPDGKQSCVIAELSELGRQDRPAAIDAIHQAAVETGIEAADVRIGGIGSDLAWLDSEGIEAPLRLVPLSLLVVVVVACVALRSIRLGLIVSALASLSAVISAALVHIFGTGFDAVTATVPTLGLLMTASLCLHWLGYYAHACDNEEKSDPINEAWRIALWPTILSALTTCIGLLSLSLSRTSAIRDFGQFGAVSTVSAALIAIYVLPSMLRLGKFHNQMQRHVRHADWVHFQAWIRKWRFILLAAALLLVLLATIGLFQLQTGVRLNNFFGENHSAVAQSRWLEEKLGSLAVLELVLSVPNYEEQNGDRLLNGLRVLQRMEAELQASGSQVNSFSALNVLPNLPRSGGARGVYAERRYIASLNKNLDTLTDRGLLSMDESVDHWRLMVHVSALDSGNTSSYREQAVWIQETANVAFANESSRPPELRPRAVVTGIPLLLEQIEQQFLEDLAITYSAAVVMIFFGVLVCLRNLRLSAVAMIPNIFPPLVVLGIIGWSGLKLEVGSVITASIALGVAVDDTMHLLYWINRKSQQGEPIRHVLPDALTHCGRAVVLTSILGGCGLAVLGVSPFLPTARFGILIASMLSVAVISDLVVLPALLSTRLGSWAVRQDHRCRPTDDSQEDIS